MKDFMFIAGTIAIKGHSIENIKNAIESISAKCLSVTIEAIRPTENAISVHIKQELERKIDKAGFQKSKTLLIDAFYSEFGRSNVAYDLGYPSL